MSLQILIGATLLAAALPLAWASVSGHRVGSLASSNLRRGMTTTDMRTAILEQSARDRALAPAVVALAKRARALTPRGLMTRLEEKLVAAGKQGTWRIEQVLAAKMALAMFAAFIAVLQLAASPSLLVGVAGLVAVLAGWFAPDVILDGKADDRRKAVERELPDTMDQVTIAVEAGLGFESALARVTRNADSTLAGEIARTLQDIQLGVNRTDALDALARRCATPDLRHFVSAVKQAERYGLPIANVLRIQSSEMREKRRQRAEEHAMKIPVKVLFPLIFCILPTMFVVILGPAGIDMARGALG